MRPLKVDPEVLAILFMELSEEQMNNVCYETHMCLEYFNGSKKERKHLSKYYKTILMLRSAYVDRLHRQMS